MILIFFTMRFSEISATFKTHTSEKSKFTILQFIFFCHYTVIGYNKGNRDIADLRYAKEDSINPSPLIFAAAKG